MKTMKKLLALLFCFVMAVGMFPMTAFAADGPNIGMEISAASVDVGDTFEITVYNNEMNVASFGCKLQFDKELVEFVSAAGCDDEAPEDIGLCRGKKFDEATLSTADEANAIGQIGFIVINTGDKDYDACVIYTATFRAKASGTVTFTLIENSSNLDMSQGDGFSGTASQQTVTVATASDSGCRHTATKPVPNNDGTHNVVCTNTECAQTVSENVKCSGTDDGDCTTAVKCACGNIVTAAKASHTGGTATCTARAKCAVCGTAYGELGDHAYGDLIPAEEAVHTQSELKPAVDAHYICSVCHKYFTADKTEVEYSDLVGQTPEHTEDPTKTTTEVTQAPTCTEEGTEVTRPFVSAADPSPVSKRPLLPLAILGVLLITLGILIILLVRLLVPARSKAAKAKKPQKRS